MSRPAYYWIPEIAQICCFQNIAAFHLSIVVFRKCQENNKDILFMPFGSLDSK